ncbi:MAG: hypothetical protein ACFFBF_00630 [Promethearchaeota archaeon]
MDTTRSERLVKNFLQREPKYKREIGEFTGTVGTTPDKIFPLLCPAREADWIPGWNPDLIYTSSGYAEEKCVFRTKKSSSAGEGLWIFTGFKLNEYIEFVKFTKDILIHSRINLTPNEDGTSTLTSKTIATAISEKGNEEIEKISDNSHNTIIHLMDYYLKNGKMISKHSLLNNKIHRQH